MIYFIVMLALMPALYLIVLFPLAIMREHLSDKSPGKPSHFGWLVLFLCGWPLSHYIYSVLHSKVPGRSAKGFFGIVFLFIAVISAVVVDSYIKIQLAKDLTYNELRIAQVRTLNPDSRAELNGNVFRLKKEIKSSPPLRPGERQVQNDLVKLLNVYLSDAKITVEEYRDWTSKFNDRHQVQFASQSSHR